MRALAVALLLAGCSPGAKRADAVASTATSDALDAAAVASGQLPVPDSRSVAGTYAATTNIGTDRMCVVAEGDRLRVGVLVSYGNGGECVGRGGGERTAGGLRATFGPGCVIDTTLDGYNVVFPGRLPPGCRTLCRGRASLAGVTIPKLSDGETDARSLTDLGGAPLCGDEGAA